MKIIFKKIEPLADILYRLFAGLFFTVSGVAGFAVIVLEAEMRGFFGISLSAVLLAIGLSCLLPNLVGRKLGKLFKLILIPVRNAIRSIIQPQIIRIISFLKFSFSRIAIPVPLFLKNIGDLINKEGENNELFFSSAWYIRYPLAVLGGAICLALADYAFESVDKGMSWAIWLWVAIIGGYSLIYARELALLCLAGVFLYWCFQGIAALPVSVAIVIGAVIIASALGAKKS